MQSDGWRNKNTKVRYASVADPHDPSGKTRVRTEHGVSSFEVSTDNLEFVPLESEEEIVRFTLDGVNQMEREMAAPYGVILHEPLTVKELAKRPEDAEPNDSDYIVLSRQLPFNLGEAVKHIWLSVHGDGNEQEHLRQARFHLADEMQRVR